MRSYTGTVIKGQGRAAALGFPTANIALNDGSISGIYTARVKVDGAEYMAATFADQKRNVLEVHLLDFPAREGSASGGSGELHGKEVAIELHKKIREHEDFANDDDLRAAIAKDVKKVRDYFRAKKTS